MTPAKTKLLLAGGIIGPILFIVLFLVEGMLRADYNPLRYPVSALAIGELGWLQASNFIITGLLLLAFALGIRRSMRHTHAELWGPILIGLVAIGLIGAGFFTSDGIYGYPTNVPLQLTQSTLGGHLHSFLSLFIFAGVPAACFVFCRHFVARRLRGQALYAALTGFGMLATFILAGVGFSQVPGFVDIAGLFQRLSISIGWIWMIVIAGYCVTREEPKNTEAAADSTGVKS